MLFALCLQLNARRWGVSLAHLLVHSLTLVNLCLAASLPYEGLLRTCSSRGTVPPPSTSLLLVLYIFAGFCSYWCSMLVTVAQQLPRVGKTQVKKNLSSVFLFFM